MQSGVIDSSWKSILTVTLPIVLINLSEAIMCNIDRMMVIGYSVDALNAVSVSANLFGVFSYLFIGIANAAEIYVGQFNGAKNFKKLSSPVWQMVYFSIASAFVFFPAAYFTEYFNLLPLHYFYDGVAYQKIIMYGGPLFPMFVAFAAFFVGQGRAQIVSFSVICGAIVNIILDYLLIYGVKGTIPRLGTAGAAIATVMAQFFQILVLLVAYCTKKNRSLALASCKPDKSIFIGCIKIGAPMSASNFLVLLAWYFVQAMATNGPKDLATVYSISVSIYTLAISLGEGLSRATSTVTANMIGRNDLDSIKRSNLKFTILALIWSLLFVIPLSIFPDKCIFSFLELLKEDVSSVYAQLATTMHWISGNVILESLLCILWGILVAGGDTVYPSVVYQFFIWSCVVIPTAICYYFGYFQSAVLVYQLSFLWLVGSLLTFYRRYRSMKWYNKLV